MARRHASMGELGMASQGGRHSEHAQRDVKPSKDAQDTPDPHPRAVLKGRLDQRAALTGHRRKANIVEEPFGGRIPIEDGRLASGFIVEVKVDGDSRIPRPLWVWGMLAIAHKIA